MNREELISKIKMTSYPRDKELIEWYCRLFAHATGDTIRSILGEQDSHEIGRQLWEGWDDVAWALENGKNEVETPLGAILYRIEESPRRKYWKELIPNTMPAQQCRDIFKDICGHWGVDPQILPAPQRKALPQPQEKPQDTGRPW